MWYLPESVELPLQQESGFYLLVRADRCWIKSLSFCFRSSFLTFRTENRTTNMYRSSPDLWTRLFWEGQRSKEQEIDMRLAQRHFNNKGRIEILWLYLSGSSQRGFKSPLTVKKCRPVPRLPSSDLCVKVAEDAETQFSFFKWCCISWFRNRACGNSHEYNYMQTQ